MRSANGIDFLFQLCWTVRRFLTTVGTAVTKRSIGSETD